MKRQDVNQELLKIPVDETTMVSGTFVRSQHARAAFVFAHGAGAGMAHPFMEAVAQLLAHREISTLRYQFPYMERRTGRPDAPPVCHATVRAAAAAARRVAPQLPLIAGGKSFGGRMTSQAQSLEPIEGVCGLAFLGFPLHPAGKPSISRAAHLNAIDIPLLFLHGANDKLAAAHLLQSVAAELGAIATLISLPHADHSLHVPKKSGKTDAAVLDEAADAFHRWVEAILGDQGM